MAKPAFVVRWQTSYMSAPAFWYFAKRETADHTAKGFQIPPVQVVVEQTTVPDDFELEDEDA